MASVSQSGVLSAGRSAAFCWDEAGSLAGDGDFLLQEHWFTRYVVQDFGLWVAVTHCASLCERGFVTKNQECFMVTQGQGGQSDLLKDYKNRILPHTFSL